MASNKNDLKQDSSIEIDPSRRKTRYIEVPEVDPERHLKRIRKAFQVSQRIQKLVRERRKSPPTVSSELELRHALEVARGQRADRLGKIAARERYVIELVSDLIGEDADALMEGFVDCQDNIILLQEFYERDGRRSIIIGSQLLPAPGMNSGRFNSKQKHDMFKNGFITDGSGIQLTMPAAAAIRLNADKGLEMSSIQEEVMIFHLPIDDDSTVLTLIKAGVSDVLQPALNSLSDYGLCKLETKVKFLHNVDLFLRFLKSTDHTLVNRVIF